MTGYYLTTSMGNVGGGEYDHLWTPRDLRAAGAPGVVLLHGANTPDQYTGLSWPASVAMAAKLADLGIPCVAAYMGGDNWCNDALITYVDAAIAYMAAKTGASAAKAHLFGTSMGGGGAWRYGIAKPAKVASIVGLIPLCDLPGYYASNMQSQIARIAPQWGKTTRTVTDGATTTGSTTISSATGFTAADVGRIVWCVSGVPTGTTIVSVSGTTATMSAAATVTGSGRTVVFADPLPPAAAFTSGAATLATIPSRIYYSSVDAVLPPATTVAFGAAIGAEKTVVVDATYGHDARTGFALRDYGAGNWREVTDFYLAHS